jgi:hypothetical protein
MNRIFSINTLSLILATSSAMAFAANDNDRAWRGDSAKRAVASFRNMEQQIADIWRSQLVTSNSSAKMGLRRPPYAFTQEGVAMLSAVLRSARAVQMSISIVRAFVRLRQIIETTRTQRHEWRSWNAATTAPHR